MGTGYTRADVSNNIADGNIINASDLDSEFDAVQAAFDAATGHTHDGTTGEGAPIEVTGPAQEYVSTGTEFRPKANNTYDLGSSGNQWKDLYVDGTANLDTVDIDAGSIDGTTIGGAAPAAGTFTTAAATTGNITTVNATTVDTTNIEVTNIKAKDGTASATIADSTGVMTIASSVLTSADINGGTIDGTVIGGSTPAAISGTTGTFSGNFTVSADAFITTGGPARGLLVGVNTGNSDSGLYYEPTGTLHLRGRGGYPLELNTAAVAGTNLKRMDIAANGDISFYEDTGTTPKFFWDASAERLGIGLTDGLYPLVVGGATGGQYIQIRSDADNSSLGLLFASSAGNNPGAIFYDQPTDAMWFRTNEVERLRITSTGSVGIGTSSPDFYSGKLTVAGGNIAIEGGNRALFWNTGGTGIASIQGVGTNELSFSTSNSFTERMRITSAGLVGIGTSSPDQPLHVYGNFPTAKIERNAGTSAASSLAFTNSTNAGHAIIASDLNLTFSYNSNVDSASGWQERLRIDASGNLLVGTTDTTVYDNNTGTSADNGLNLRSDGKLDAARYNGIVLGLNRTGTDGTLAEFRKDGTVVGSIGSIGGDIYVGTDSTTMRFTGSDIRPTNNTGANNDNAIDLGDATSRWKDLYLSGSAIIDDGAGRITLDASSGVNYLYSTTTGFAAYEDLSIAADNLIFRSGSSATERLRITSTGACEWRPDGSTQAMTLDASGNLLVGLTSASAKLHVLQAGTVPTAQFTNNNGSFASDGVFIYNTRTTTNSTYNHLACGNGDFSGVFLVRDSGNVVNTNNSYGAISDIKLKENVTDTTPKLNQLKQVRVVNYNLLGQDQKQLGVVAQEIEQIFPSMVEEAPDRDKDGNDLGTTTKSVKYSVFVPMLIKAMQEQQSIIEALEARITALEA